MVFHHAYREVRAHFQVGAKRLYPGIHEPAFLHDATGGRVGREVAAPERREALFAKTIVNDQLQRFRTDTFTPIRTGDPIAHLALVIGNLKVG